ncbi:MAG TPA: RhoGEF domain-containing protein, partial [Gammaproteobacteria bacterium]|nr:RhoGEF domain-containing protein [Gammaproteobacteria bacterium]
MPLNEPPKLNMPFSEEELLAQRLKDERAQQLKNEQEQKLIADRNERVINAITTKIQAYIQEPTNKGFIDVVTDYLMYKAGDPISNKDIIDAFENEKNAIGKILSTMTKEMQTALLSSKKFARLKDFNPNIAKVADEVGIYEVKEKKLIIEQPRAEAPKSQLWNNLSKRLKRKSSFGKVNTTIQETTEAVAKVTEQPQEIESKTPEKPQSAFEEAESSTLDLVNFIDDLEKKEQKTVSILEELKATEQSFITGFLKPHEILSLSVYGSATKNTSLEDLARNATDIIESSKALQEVLSKVNAPEELGNILEMYKSHVQLLSQYSQNYETIQKQANPEFYKFLDSFGLDPTTKLSMGSKLIVGAQRAPRYILLLTDLLKNSTTLNGDRVIKDLLAITQDAFAVFDSSKTAIKENKDTSKVEVESQNADIFEEFDKLIEDVKKPITENQDKNTNEKTLVFETSTIEPPKVNDSTEALLNNAKAVAEAVQNLKKVVTPQNKEASIKETKPETILQETKKDNALNEQNVIKEQPKVNEPEAQLGISVSQTKDPTISLMENRLKTVTNDDYKDLGAQILEDYTKAHQPN